MAASTAERVREFRQRRRTGRIQIGIEADEVALTVALTENGFLQTPDPSHEDIAAALQQVVDRWVEGES
jgi:hypothetical protein